MPGLLENTWILLSTSVFKLLWYQTTGSLAEAPLYTHERLRMKKPRILSIFMTIVLTSRDPLRSISVTSRGPWNALWERLFYKFLMWDNFVVGSVTPKFGIFVYHSIFKIFIWFLTLKISFLCIRFFYCLCLWQLKTWVRCSPNNFLPF